MQYLRRIARNVFAVERWRLRGWSAVRRGVVVVLALVIPGYLLHPEIGGMAAAAALMVGLQDRATDPPRYTVRIMTLESVLLAAVVLVAGLTSSVIVAAGLLLLCAYAAGALADREWAVSRLFADVIALEAFLGLTTVETRTASWVAVCVLVAGLAQTLLTRLSVPWQSDLPERRPLGLAMLAVADHLEDAQRRQRSGTGQFAEEMLTEAVDTLRRSDLSHERRRALRRLVFTTESLRQEASSLRARRAFGAAVITDPAVDDALALAVATLRAAARLITTQTTPGLAQARTTNALREMSGYSRKAAAVAADDSAPVTARAIAGDTQRITFHAAQLLRASDERRPSRQLHILRNTVTLLRTPTGYDLKSGIRLVLAAGLGLYLAWQFQINHGAWVAATAVALLRPDYSAMVSETIARALGTAAGVALVIPLVALVDKSEFSEVVLVGALAVLAFMVVAANEGLFVLVVAVWVVFLRAVVGEDPVMVAFDRFLDTILGCVLAVVLIVFMPLRSSSTLRTELEGYAAATAKWLSALAEMVAGNRRSGAAQLHRRMRESRVPVQHELTIRQLEPIGPGLSPQWGENMFRRVHSVERAAGAVESVVKHGAPPSDAARAALKDATADMERAAALLRGTPGGATGVELYRSPDVVPEGPLGELVLVTREEAHRAAQLAAELNARTRERREGRREPAPSPGE